MLRFKAIYFLAFLSMLVLLGLFSYFEIKNTESDIDKVVNVETLTLFHSIRSAVENSINSTSFFDDLIIEKMLSFPLFVVPQNAQIFDSNHIFFEFGINEFYCFNCSTNQIFINPIKRTKQNISNFKFNKNDYGLILSTNVRNALNKRIPKDLLVQILSEFHNRTNWLELGNLTSPFTGDEVYFIARFFSNFKRCCLVGISTKLLSNWRRKFSFGRIIKEIGNMPEVLYFVLQDSLGIIASSSNFNILSTFSEDKFLHNLKLDTYKVRKFPIIINDTLQSISLKKIHTNSNKKNASSISDSNSLAKSPSKVVQRSKEIYEIVMRINTGNGEYLLARLGLSDENIKHLKTQSIFRIILSNVVFFALVLTIIYLFFFRQKFRNLFSKHTQFRFYLEQIFENSAEAIVLFDENFNIILKNNFSDNIFNLEGKLSYFEIFPDDPLKINSLKQYFESTKEVENSTQDRFYPQKFVEIEYETTNDKKILGCRIVYVRTDLLNFYLLVAIDLSEIRRLQKQIAETEKFVALGTAAATFAHEIRNPLNSISMAAQRIELETDLPKPYKDLFLIIQQEIERVNEIINQFVNLAKPEEINPRLIKVNDIIVNTVKLIDEMAMSKNIQIINRVEANPFINGDPEKLKQSFLNLILNSIDAIEESGKIIISTRVIGKNLHVIFEDNGYGIPQEIIDKVTNPFFTTKRKGLGIGLSLSQRIIHAHQGDIQIESVVGVGTKVIIQLPIVN